MSDEHLKKSLSDIQSALGKAYSSGAGKSIKATRLRYAIVAVIGVLAVALFISRDSQEPAPIAKNPTSTPNQSVVASALVSAGVQFDDSIPADRGLPLIHVTAALVKELGAQHPIFVYRPRARWPIASITKLMTAMLAMDELGPATILTISQDAVDTEGTSGDLRAGEKYTVNDLIKLMLTVSSNDAAAALAQAYDKKELGDEAYAGALNKTALFVALMQQKAKDLGMQETYFGDSIGLSMINQSVVGDLDLLLAHVAATHPELLETTRQTKTRIVERNKMLGKNFTNINQYAGQKDFLGGKTGFTEEAGQNLISLFSYNGTKYEITVLGSEDRFGDTTALYTWLKSALPQPTAPVNKKP